MEKQFKICLKNGETVSLVLYPEKYCNSSYYKIDARSGNKIIASAIFKLKNRECTLCRIEIIFNEYSHGGLCTHIINLMEKFALENGCLTVGGKFYPFGELGKHAHGFYSKNGYEIYKDGYETYIFKQLNKNLIQEKTI